MNLCEDVDEAERHLQRLRAATPRKERHRVFLEQCRAWHPDKNVGKEQIATQMFQHLQTLRSWFLNEAEAGLIIP
jgi:hypothetical protein